MLSELSVRQFALIEDVRIELGPGMTVFTGETGAGKSILIDALGAAFGARAQADWVRHGAGKAEITALWEGLDEPLVRLLEAHDLPVEEPLILRRVIQSDGRSRAYVGGTPVPARILAAIGELCLDLHGQHEHQMLLRPEFQRGALDARIDPSLHSRTEEAWRAWNEARMRLARFHEQQQSDALEAERMREDLARLEALNLEPGLVERLEAEVEAGRHHAQIQQAAQAALALLDEVEPSARELLAQAIRELSRVLQHHPGIAEASRLGEEADALLGEMISRVRDVAGESFDQQAFLASEQRLMDLHEAMRRHRTDEDGLIALLESLRERVSALDTAEWDEADLQRAVDEAAAAYRDAAKALSEARESAAGSLARELRPVLDRLALAGMQVRIRVDAHPENENRWTASGWDAICFEVMSNVGEPWRELAQVASGGELSRLVLALKACGAMERAPKLAVFDEVDVGIGGETAWSVGRLLKAMGRDRQVLVISHLPQVAAMADAHLAIRKEVSQGRTLTRLEPVRGEARRHELARMLGGREDEETLRHAARLLERAAEN